MKKYKIPEIVVHTVHAVNVNKMFFSKVWGLSILNYLLWFIMLISTKPIIPVFLYFSVYYKKKKIIPGNHRTVILYNAIWSQGSILTLSKL